MGSGLSRPGTRSLSIGSTGTTLSIGSVGSFLSIGSIASAFSIASSLSVPSVMSNMFRLGLPTATEALAEPIP